MRTAAAVVAGIILTVSWIAAAAVAVGVEYVGWKMVISDHKVVAGLAIALILVSPAFMLTQTVIGLLAVPFGMVAEGGASATTDDA